MKGKLLFWQFWAKKRPKFGRLAKHHFDFLCWLKGVILSYPLCTFFVRNPIPSCRRDLRPQNGYAALFGGILIRYFSRFLINSRSTDMFFMSLSRLCKRIPRVSFSAVIASCCLPKNAILFRISFASRIF